MWSSFLDTLQTQLQNQVVAGGIALGLAGILVAALRKVPGMLWAQLQRLVVATAVIDSRNDIFNAYVAWLNDLPFGRKSRLFTVVQAPPDPGETVGTLPRLLFSPAPGMHVFWHDGHVMWIERTIAMNLQVVETIRVSMLFARRAKGKLALSIDLAQIRSVARGKYGANKKILDVTVADGQTHRLMVDDFDRFGAALREQLAGRGATWQVA